MPDDLKFLLNIGTEGSLFLVVWFLLTKFIPRIVEQFVISLNAANDLNRRQAEKYMEEMENQRADFAKHLEQINFQENARNQELTKAVNSLTKAVEEG
jgi:small-conductance mechanosensitive channel